MQESDPVYDICVVGGGINGAGIALDAAGRGLRVLLCEQGDLGGATSSQSSKLIHGGLRYLEFYEFRLVREALAERSVLWHKAPHLIRPLRFRLPVLQGLRPGWLIRCGLFLYDLLAPANKLPRSRRFELAANSPLQAKIRHGYEYGDLWVDDARLVIANAMAARDRGADVLSRTRCTRARRESGLWQISLQSSDGTERQVVSRVLVNAAGPWVDTLASGALGGIAAAQASVRLRLVKGSHIIVPRLHDGEEAYILQHDDGRIVFVLPYEGRYSLIGTTDEPHHGLPEQVDVSPAEERYLLKVVNRYFRKQRSRDDIVARYAGVRPLLEEEGAADQKLSRDYRLLLDDEPGQAPLLTVLGGKITTYRRLSEKALDLLRGVFPRSGPAWTNGVHLPGGSFTDWAALQQVYRDRYPWLPDSLRVRLLRGYGTLCATLLDRAAGIPDLGQHFGAGLYQREVDYLCRREWALTAEDILWRRTKLGLQLRPAQVDALQAYLDQRLSEPLEGSDSSAERNL